jgi:hypothetical protein
MPEIVRCSKGHENPAGARYCMNCTEPLGETSEASNMEGASWRRDAEYIATRVDYDDFPATLKKGIVVEQGNKALLFINGALAEILEPGLYNEGLLNRISNLLSGTYRKVTAVIVDASDLEFTIIIPAYTKDPLSIDIRCNVVVQIADYTSFYDNVMKRMERYPKNELRASLYFEMQNAFNALISERSVSDLNWNLALKRDFEVSVEKHLETTFQRNGFRFIQLRTIDYNFKGYDKIRGINEEVFLLVSEEDAKLKGRKRLFDVYDESQLQDIFEETKKTEHYRMMSKQMVDRKRAKMEADLDVKGVEADQEIGEWKVAADTRKRLKEYLLDKGKSDEEIEIFLMEIEKGKLLRDEEMRELKITLDEKAVDHNLRRQFAIRQLSLQQELDYERQRLVGKEGIEKEVLEKQIDKKKVQLDAEIDELKIRNLIAREEQVKNNEVTFRIELDKAKTEAEKKRIELELEKLEDENDLLALEKLQAVNRKEDHERMLTELERQTKLQALEMEKIRAAQQHEIDKIKTFDNVKVEAILAMVGPEQARIIKEMRESENLKDLSEEKVKWIMAQKSPELAKALEALSHEERDAFYKQIMEEKDKTLQEKDKAMAQFEREHNKALDTAKDIAVGVAQSGRANVVYPPYGQGVPPGGFYPGPGGGPGAPGFYNVQMGTPEKEVVFVTICPSCKKKIEFKAPAKRCPFCRYEIEAD